MRAQRRDANEMQLVEMARRCGFQMVMAPPLDWWAQLRGKWAPVEIKSGKNGYTPAQVIFLKDCETRGAPVHTWRGVDDVILAANSW